MAGCSNASDQEPAKETKQEMKQELLTLTGCDNVDLNTTETTTVTAESFAETFDLYLKTFSHVAYIAVNINEKLADHYDITLIPMTADCGKVIAEKLSNLPESNVGAFSSKDKKEFNNWVNEKQKEGNTVVTSYDKNAGEYTAVTYTKSEWAVLVKK